MLTDGTALLAALPRMDRAIVNELGSEGLESFEADPEMDLSEVLGTADTTAAEVTSPDDTQAVADAEPETGEQTDPMGGETQATDTTGTAADTAPGAQLGTPQTELRPLTALLNDQGIAGQFLVAEQDVPTVERYLALEGVQNAIPRSVTLHWGTEVMSLGGSAYRPLYALEENPILTGEFLEDAGPAQRDPTFNQPIVPFQTTRRGARIFERGTAPNVGKNMAIVLDNRVQSYAVLRSTLSRRAQIELAPGSPLQEAQDLALVLRAGALPQPIQIVAEHTVGPSLGADSIRQGTRAFIIGIIGVVLVMISYYRVAGVMAIGALAVYVLLVMGGLAGLGANLTLPGIAGLILSVGMGVDANVLIFERIREEVEAEKTPRTAVEAGFANALSAIVDANLTTLITGIILFQFGTGPIRGFAVTLCIGILASFFSAVFVTRTFFMIYLDRRSPSAPVSI
jgi:preprotein translocase subunit SecD